MSTALLDRTEGEREKARERGSKCNKGAVNGLGLRVKKENKWWPARRRETEGIQRQRKRCRKGKAEKVRDEDSEGDVGESRRRKWNWRLL